MRPTEIDVNDYVKQQREKVRYQPAKPGMKYVTPTEYAELTGLHLMTVHKWLRQGRIDGAYKLGSRWRVPVSQ